MLRGSLCSPECESVYVHVCVGVCVCVCVSVCVCVGAQALVCHCHVFTQCYELQPWHCFHTPDMLLHPHSSAGEEIWNEPSLPPTRQPSNK